MKQRITILGSTGSIGEQTLDIVRENPDRFEVAALTAHRQWQRLAEQAIAFNANTVVIGDSEIESGKVIVKDMDGGESVEMELEGFEDSTAQSLAEHIAYGAKRRRSDNHADDITVIAVIIDKAV